MTTLNDARVQKHRARLLGQPCRRLEVSIGIIVIENVREIAKRKRVPMWVTVQDALVAYVAGNGKPEGVSG